MHSSKTYDQLTVLVEPSTEGDNHTSSGRKKLHLYKTLTELTFSNLPLSRALVRNQL